MPSPSLHAESQDLHESRRREHAEEEAALERGEPYAGLGDGVSAQPYEEIGVIAQDFLNTELSFIVREGDATHPHRVMYSNLTCLNTGAIQKLASQVALLTARISALERIAALESSQ